jgi:hypothetical protein
MCVCVLLQATCLLYRFLFAVWRASRETLPSCYLALHVKSNKLGYKLPPSPEVIKHTLYSIIRPVLLFESKRTRFSFYGHHYTKFKSDSEYLKSKLNNSAVLTSLTEMIEFYFWNKLYHFWNKLYHFYLPYLPFLSISIFTSLALIFLSILLNSPIKNIYLFYFITNFINHSCQPIINLH